MLVTLCESAFCAPPSPQKSGMGDCVKNSCLTTAAFFPRRDYKLVILRWANKLHFFLGQLLVVPAVLLNGSFSTGRAWTGDIWQFRPETFTKVPTRGSNGFNYYVPVLALRLDNNVMAHAAFKQFKIRNTCLYLTQFCENLRGKFLRALFSWALCKHNA